MAYSLEQVESFHNQGVMPDWIYYQLNGKSLQENYQDVIHKMQQDFRKKQQEELQNQEIEKEVSEYVEKSLDNILDKLLKDINIDIK